MTKKTTVMALAAVMFTASAFGFSGAAFAETTTTPTTWKSSQHNIKSYLKHTPGVSGKVISISGSTIIIDSNYNTPYSIDASTAKIIKNRNTIITIADIATGDTIMAQGKVDGTNVVATTIFDGKILSKKLGKHKVKI